MEVPDIIKTFDSKDKNKKILKNLIKISMNLYSAYFDINYIRI